MHNHTTHPQRTTLQHLRNDTNVISVLIPYSSLILSVCCVITFMMKYYLFEPLAKRYYGDRYSRLSDTQKRTFINHHVAGTCKLILVILGVYPTIALLIGPTNLHSGYAGSKHVLMGDVLIVVYEIFAAMYIFELIYRTSVSPISAAHHVGSILISQSATVLGFDAYHRGDAKIEFVLCLLWGVFDVVAEFWPHLVIILYRVYPNRHLQLYRLFIAATILEAAGTLIETIVVMWIFGTLWPEWSLAFKVVTPILHVLFSFAQLFGAKVFWDMAQKQKKLIDLALPTVREDSPEMDIAGKKEGDIEGEDRN